MTTIPELYSLFLQYRSVCTDSRKVAAGDLFFALRGPSFDGNKYAADALKKGAAYAIIDNADFAISDKYLLVPDALLALQQLARHHRNHLNIPFIAIAGSNGKTTTKELLRAVLSTSFETFATPGNFNNQIGVPLSIFMIPERTEVAIIEMGARHMGDIKELCEICNPTHGLVTNNGKDHLETFGSLENTLKTNAELYDHLATNNGLAFINIRHQDLMGAAAKVKNIFSYGDHQQAEIRGSIASLFPYLRVRYVTEQAKINIESHLIGQYNFENIMAAVAVGKHFGVNDRLIAKAIADYVPSNNRSQLLQQGSNTFIMDAYNANPSSMKEALDNFALIDHPNKVVILGDMLELGPTSQEEHLLTVLQLKKIPLSKIILIGPEFGRVKDKLDCLHFETAEEGQQWFAQENFDHTLFLLKGSRGIAVEKVLGDWYKP
ncbi:MAG: UDP-N-acetylmuramoyl-tripeptide--D-alanyl-D-alanine ligase [Chitinophagales bacterium]|nr:UDP-N-acetylmuramoyl-tripeptide--D-alanyl-D-alanine ligase [Chitinophagales bacterium]